MEQEEQEKDKKSDTDSEEEPSDSEISRRRVTEWGVQQDIHVGYFFTKQQNGNKLLLEIKEYCWIVELIGISVQNNTNKQKKTNSQGISLAQWLFPVDDNNKENNNENENLTEEDYFYCYRVEFPKGEMTCEKLSNFRYTDDFRLGSERLRCGLLSDVFYFKSSPYLLDWNTPNNDYHLYRYPHRKSHFEKTLRAFEKTNRSYFVFPLRGRYKSSERIESPISKDENKNVITNTKSLESRWYDDDFAKMQIHDLKHHYKYTLPMDEQKYH